MKKLNRTRWLLLGASACALGACNLAPPRLDAEAQWADAISRLGMFSIYPPSEDVMVGDTFLHAPGGRFFDLVRITAAPRTLLAQQFCYQEQDRMASDTVGNATAGTVNTDVECGNESAADPDVKSMSRTRIATFSGTVTPQHVTRMREAGLPELTVGRFSEGEIAGAGLLGNLGAALGVGWSAGTAVRVQLDNLQAITMDELRSSRMVQDVTASRANRIIQGRRDYPNSLTPLMMARSLLMADNRNGAGYSAAFCRGDFRELNKAGVQVIVANRVLYAETIRFNFLRDSISTTRLALDFASALEGRPQAPTVPDLPRPPQGSGDTNRNTEPTPRAPQGGARAAPRATTSRDSTAPTSVKERDRDGQERPPLDLNARRAEMLAGAARIATLGASTPSQASGRLVTGSYGTLALERPFVRPAAVGMGAALHYPVADAAVPASRDQIEETLLFCRMTHGVADQHLIDRLVANYGWALFLAERNRNQGAIDVAQALARERLERSGYRVPSFLGGTERWEGTHSRLEPLRPSADVRVRL